MKKILGIAFAVVAICISVFLWIAFLLTTPDFLKNPFAVVGACILVLGLVVIAIVLAIRSKNQLIKSATIICSVLASIMTLVYCLVMFSAVGFQEYAYNRVAEKYRLSDAMFIGASMPADQFFPEDNDGSVDTTEIKDSYGHRYIGIAQGISDAGEDNYGKKLLIVYEYKVFSPLSTVTVFKLDESYNTLMYGFEQGYGQEEDGGGISPIESVVITNN